MCLGGSLLYRKVFCFSTKRSTVLKSFTIIPRQKSDPKIFSSKDIPLSKFFGKKQLVLLESFLVHIKHVSTSSTENLLDQKKRSLLSENL